MLLLAVQVLPEAQARLVMLAQRAQQALGLHRVTLGHLMLAVQVTPAQQLQPIVRTPLKFGRSNRLQSQWVVGARRAKSPFLGDGPC